MTKKRLDWRHLRIGQRVVATGGKLPSCLIHGQGYVVDADEDGWPFIRCGDQRRHYLNDPAHIVDFAMEAGAPPVKDEPVIADNVEARCRTLQGTGQVVVHLELGFDDGLTPVAVQMNTGAAAALLNQLTRAIQVVQEVESRGTRH